MAGYGAVSINGPGGEEPVWAHDEGDSIRVAEFVELDEVQHVGFWRRVEGAGWEGEVGDGVAVDSGLAGRWVGERIGD